MSRVAIRCFAIWTVLCMAFGAQAVTDIVLIDSGEQAYTVYAGLPAERAEGIRAKIANAPAQLVTFNEFSEGRARFVGGKIVIDEYPGLRAEEGIVELVRKYPGTPFGITWNGGIAFTRMDYKYAKEQFAIYAKDAEAYRQARNAAAAGDPINPKLHLGPLLGW